MSSSEDGLNVLQQWAKEGSLAKAKLSSDGATLTLNDVALESSKVCEVSFQSKSCKYTLASLFLQVLDPNQGLLPYRNLCKSHNVSDPVKVLDKPIVVGYLLGSKSSAAEPQEEPKKQEAIQKQQRHHDRKHDHHHRHDKKRRSSGHKKRRHSDEAGSDVKKQKKIKAPMTDEQLFSNLNVVVDKRTEEEDATTTQNLKAALSTVGFTITKEIVEQYRDETEQIQQAEIPVGHSASILRSSQQNRDFSQVLDLYLQTMKQQSSSHRSDSSSKSKSPKTGPVDKAKSYLVGKKPIIVVPKGMTSPITLVNAHEFLAKSKFVPRDVQIKQSSGAPATSFSRKVASRLGGGVVEYELMDNPKSKLGQNPKEWARVVAVIALGASWQFKDWLKEYNTAVNLFSSTFGFYVGMEGDPLPQELLGWNVKRGKLNRDKRGLDSVTYASFWNGLDEWMAVHKREMLPKRDM